MDKKIDDNKKIEDKKETKIVAEKPKGEKKVFSQKKHEPKEQVPQEHKSEAKEKPIFVKKKNLFPEYKMFNKWDTSEVVVKDLSLVRYINLDTIIIPHTFGRKGQGRFAKANVNIVERLINKIMRSGQGKRKLSGKYVRGRGSCGKKMQAIQIVERAFEIVEKKTKKNPIQVLVDAVENAAPREDITRIKRGGVAYSLAVDVSPIKRLDEALKHCTRRFGNSLTKVSAEEALAEEIIAAAAGDMKSSALKRKEEVERVARASR